MFKNKRHIQTAFRSQKIRFGLVGITNTIIDFGILNILVFLLGIPLIASNIVSTTVAMAVSFVLNKKTVFRSGGDSRRQAVLFVLVTLAGIWIVQTCIVVLAYSLLEALPPELRLNLAKIIGIMFGMIWNYLWYSQVVFKNKVKITGSAILQYAVSRWKVVVISTGVLALVIMMILGSGRSVWFDEGYSIMLAQRPVSEMMALTKIDAHPPLYYLYLKGWGTAFGWSEVSLRLSSMIPMAISISFMLIVLRRLFTVRLAVTAAPFLVLAPFALRYGYEIRMYALVTLIGVVATWVLLKARETESRKWWISYALLVAAGMYTLYMSMVIWVAHALWLLYVDLHEKRNPILRKHWLYYLLSVTLFAAWLPTVQYQLANSALPPYMASLTLESLVNVGVLALSYTPSWEASPLLITVAIAFITILSLLLFHVWRRASKKERRGLALLLIGFMAAIIFYWIISTPPNPPRFVERYMAHISLFFYGLIGATVYLGYKAQKKLLAFSLAILSLGLLLYGATSLYVKGNYNFQRLQPTYAKVIKQDFACKDTTFVTSGAYGFIDMWYDFQGCDFRYLQPVDLTYVGGFAPLNKLSQTDRVKGLEDLASKKVVFIYFDDSTEFFAPSERYIQTGQYDYDDSAHITLYERVDN